MKTDVYIEEYPTSQRENIMIMYRYFSKELGGSEKAIFNRQQLTGNPTLRCNYV